MSRVIAIALALPSWRRNLAGMGLAFGVGLILWAAIIEGLMAVVGLAPSH